MPFATGTAQRFDLAGETAGEVLGAFGRVLDRLDGHQAVGLGVEKTGLPEVQVTTKARAAKTRQASRTLDHWGYRDGPGLFLADVDGGTGFNALAEAVYPPWADVATLTRASVSAGISNTKTGETLGASGEHVYVVIDDVRSAQAAAQALERLFWANGRGRVLVASNGALLRRSPVDLAVFSPERVIYEGPARVSKPLVAPPRECAIREGGVLVAADLIAFAAARISAAAADALFRQACEDPTVQAESAAKRAAWREARIAASMARGHPREAAEAEINAFLASERQAAQDGQSYYSYTLPLDERLTLDDGATVTPREIRADLKRWADRTLPDPIEGPAYGAGKAKILAGDPARGGPYIRSFAHGLTVYQFAREDAREDKAGEEDPDDPGASDPPPDGEPGQAPSDEDALNARALANLDAWLPILIPNAVRRDDGSYLIATDREGMVLGEPIIATAQGISGSSPIGLYEQWLDMPRADAARMLDIVLQLATASGGGGDEVSPREAKARERQKHKKDLNDLYKESAKGRTTIQYHTHAFTSAAEQTEREMMKRGLAVYARGNTLVRPVVVAAEGADEKPTMVAQLAKIKVPYMRQLMDRAAVYEFPDESKFEPIFPPKDIAELILNRAGDWRFPQVIGVITAPTLRPDGSLLDTPGYDPATRLYLTKGITLSPIPDEPTREDALAALDRLDGLLEEFPFVDAASRSVALSALITPVARGMLPFAPIHAFTAPTAGTGKSFLADVSSAILTGFHCVVQPVGRTDEETEKRLTGSLLRGGQIMSLDNINGVFGSDLLCQIATQHRIEVRRLGGSDKEEVETRATVFMNGNNLALTGDLTRRAIVARLDAEMEKPYERQFRGDPVATVMSDRGRFIADVLTIVRAYRVAGHPDVLPKLASFTSWSDNVRSALVWLGRADPCETMERARDDDPELGRAAAVFEAWGKELGANEEEYKVSDIIQAITVFAGDHPLLREAVMAVAGRRGMPEAQLLGFWLARYRDRVIGSLQLTGGGKTSSARRWRMRRTLRGSG